MGNSQRIAILGDFHLSSTDATLTREAMQDIRQAEPGLVVALGDFGAHENIGFPEGIEMAWRHLSQIEAPVRPILGNHDLQVESAQKQTPGTMEAALCRIAELECSYGMMEFETHRFLFVTTEYQPRETCWQAQECYVSDRQFDLLCKQLARRPGVPVIVFSHAPPIGCGLKTHPETHPRATNAYLEQNHHSFRWRQLYRDTPEIVLWFSAHYHLGHDHPDSHTERFGTHFFHAQVHGDGTRDGTRQTRLLEIEEGKVAIATLDHIKRQRREPLDWEPVGNLRDLVEAKARAGAAHGDFLPFSVDGSPILHVYPLPGSRVLIHTEKNFLWEIDLASGSPLGTHHLGCPLTAVAVSGDRVWRAWGGSLAVSHLSSLQRFVRDRLDNPESRVGWIFPDPVRCLVASNQGRVLVLTRQAVWEVDPLISEPLRVFHSATRELAGISQLDEGYLISARDGCILHSAKLNLKTAMDRGDLTQSAGRE